MEKTANYLRAVAALLAPLDEDAPAAYESAREAAREAYGTLSDADERERFAKTLAFPGWAVRRRFEWEVLAGGGAWAALPVESLYKPWASPAVGNRGAHGAECGAARHLYLGDAAQHVLALYRELQLEVPAGFSAMPDHVALLAELVALYAEAANEQAVRDLLADHFDWLGAYDAAIAARQEALAAAPGLDATRRDEVGAALAHGRRLVALLDEGVAQLALSLDDHRSIQVGSKQASEGGIDAN